MQKIAVKSDWHTQPMPARRETALLRIAFSPEQLATLVKGWIPREMEDKWFCYYEAGKLHVHRSWTGFCVFILEFRMDTQLHRITLNRQPDQPNVDIAFAEECLKAWAWPWKEYRSHPQVAQIVDDLLAGRALPPQEKTRQIIRPEQGDITALFCDCIVNAANQSLLGGSGVDGAIHRAAGPGLLEECRKLHGCRTGEAKITGGYNLKARYVIHTVGPVYSGTESDAKLLASCYRNSLELAKQHNLHSIAFPAISTGVYRYPMEQAAAVALKTIRQWLAENEDYEMTVILSCFGDSAYETYCRLLKE